MPAEHVRRDTREFVNSSMRSQLEIDILLHFWEIPCKITSWIGKTPDHTAKMGVRTGDGGAELEILHACTGGTCAAATTGRSGRLHASSGQESIRAYNGYGSSVVGCRGRMRRPCNTSNLRDDNATLEHPSIHLVDG